jgi:hypothetical protein
MKVAVRSIEFAGWFDLDYSERANCQISYSLSVNKA